MKESKTKLRSSEVSEFYNNESGVCVCVCVCVNQDYL